MIPSASGSAFLEVQSSQPRASKSIIPPSSSLKLTCSVHGPHSLPRSAPFSSNILLNSHVKFAPFASRRRRGYLRDISERDLGVHLETALRGAVIVDRWPKSGLDISITILEGEDDRWWGDDIYDSSASSTGMDGWGLMNVLAACINVASAAVADAGIDCLDLIAGGVSAVVEDRDAASETQTAENTALDDSRTSRPGRRYMAIDPDPSEHSKIISACVVGYMPSCDEITSLWLKGNVSPTDKQLGHEMLVDYAVDAATASQSVVAAAIGESILRASNEHNVHKVTNPDIEMT